VRTHPQESAISIIHHGRDRRKLLPLVYENHGSDFGNELTQSEFQKLARRALRAVDTLTPQDDTVIRADSILKYLDLAKVDSLEFLYTFNDIQAAVYRLWSKPPQLEPEERQWLKARGVIERQLEHFRSFSQVESRQDRISLGIEVHPAIQEWVGQTTPKGVAYPATGAHGTIVGCHLRFLSTVPKIKFGASCPLVHLSTNIFTLGGGDGVWLVEGIFDGLALDRLELPYVSPSSGTWSSEQLSNLISFLRHVRPPRVYAAHDGDRVGLKENLFLWSVLQEEFKVEVFLYPPSIKDMAELVCKHHKDPRDIGSSDAITVAEHYLAQPYEPVVDFDRYLDHRNSAYSNDRYQWTSDS
jgi:hypothetical protein